MLTLNFPKPAGHFMAFTVDEQRIGLPAYTQATHSNAWKELTRQALR